MWLDHNTNLQFFSSIMQLIFEIASRFANSSYPPNRLLNCRTINEIIRSWIDPADSGNNRVSEADSAGKSSRAMIRHVKTRKTRIAHIYSFTQHFALYIAINRRCEIRTKAGFRPDKRAQMQTRTSISEGNKLYSITIILYKIISYIRKILDNRLLAKKIF